jgi:hypothetical protein
MKKLLLSVTFTAILASLAEAQPVSDARVADLVQAGKIRVGVHSVMYTKDPQTGEPKGASVGAPAKPIDRPSHDHVEFPARRSTAQRIEGGALITTFGAADAVVLVYFYEIAAHTAGDLAQLALLVCRRLIDG